MNKHKLLEKAIHIAVNAHYEQTDKAGKPYIFHPLRVMDRCANIDEKIIAILHDTIEDTDVTPDRLISDDFPPYIIEAIQSLTKNKNEPYEEFIQRVALNPLATKVKIADIQDNLDLSRLDRITDSDFARVEKYVKSLAFLRQKQAVE